MNVEPNTIALDEISIVSGVAAGLAIKFFPPYSHQKNQSEGSYLFDTVNVSSYPQ